MLVVAVYYSRAASAQEPLSPGDRSKLLEAEKVAARFVERFRQTRDFGTIWKEFRSSSFSCVVKTFVDRNVVDDPKLPPGLLERNYVAFLSYYYLKSAHDLSKVTIDSKLGEGKYTSANIISAHKRSKFFNDDASDPKTIAEVLQSVVEAERIAKLYKAKLPKNVMSSEHWRKNRSYLRERGGDNRIIKTEKDGSHWCTGANENVYVVNAGIFYFYIVEEHGQMKVTGLGIGN